MLKLNLGSGNNRMEGYVNIDITQRNHPVDLIHDLNTNLPYEPGSVDEMIAYHVVEHFRYNPLRARLAHWRTLLKVGGVLIIETPDSSKLLPIVVEKTSSGEEDWEWASWVLYAGEHGHRCALTPAALRRLLGEGWAITECEPQRPTGFPIFRFECIKV